MMAYLFITSNIFVKFATGVDLILRLFLQLSRIGPTRSEPFLTETIFENFEITITWIKKFMQEKFSKTNDKLYIV